MKTVRTSESELSSLDEILEDNLEGFNDALSSKRADEKLLQMYDDEFDRGFIIENNIALERNTKTIIIN